MKKRGRIKKVSKKTNRQTKIKKKKNKDLTNNDIILLIPIRYLFLLFFVFFSLPVVYQVLTPMTVYPVAGLLDILYKDVAIIPHYLEGPAITINKNTIIEIVPACVAGSAYLLLLILNLSVPMSVKKRFYTLTLSVVILLGLNILRIFSLSMLYYLQAPFFDFTHKFFWYALSTIFVVAIWFFVVVKLFKVKEVPIHDDLQTLYKEIQQKGI